MMQSRYEQMSFCTLGTRGHSSSTILLDDTPYFDRVAAGSWFVNPQLSRIDEIPSDEAFHEYRI
jgi:hypothetical protein